MTVQQFRRPGANVEAIQLTARALPAIRSELAARDIHHEVHPNDGHLLLHSERGPRPLRWGDWLVVEGDGFWDVYGDVVIKTWQVTEDRTRYESHAWSPRTDEDDDECVACGVTWQDCEGDCPGVTA